MSNEQHVSELRNPYVSALYVVPYSDVDLGQELKFSGVSVELIVRGEKKGTLLQRRYWSVSKYLHLVKSFIHFCIVSGYLSTPSATKSRSMNESFFSIFAACIFVRI